MHIFNSLDHQLDFGSSLLLDITSSRSITRAFSMHLLMQDSSFGRSEGEVRDFRSQKRVGH